MAEDNSTGCVRRKGISSTFLQERLVGKDSLGMMVIHLRGHSGGRFAVNREVRACLTFVDGFLLFRQSELLMAVNGSLAVTSTAAARMNQITCIRVYSASSVLFMFPQFWRVRRVAPSPEKFCGTCLEGPGLSLYS